MMIKVGRLFREKMAQSIAHGVKNKGAAFVVNYQGISAAQMNVIRKDLKKRKADVYVSRNSIVRWALKGAALENIANHLQGQTALVLSDTDACEISKVLVKFSKAWEGLVIQGGLLNGAVITGNDVKKLAALPSREVLLAQIMGTLQAPLTRLAGALNAKTRDIMSILKQISEKK